jgi:pimeloyl-ACP methyl ester carboxylesterase
MDRHRSQPSTAGPSMSRIRCTTGSPASRIHARNPARSAFTGLVAPLAAAAVCARCWSPPPRRRPQTEPFAGSGEIGYLDIGTGPVALFVHGIATNAYLRRHVIGAVAGRRRCIALDLPPHGRSPVTAGQDLSVAALAAALEGYCEAPGLTGIDLVASDTGGAVAQIFAARHPQALTNCDTAGPTPSSR